MRLLLLALIQGRGGGALLWLAMVAVMMGRVCCDLATGADQSWLLMVEDGRGEAEDRRITPKSVFIAPALTSRAQRCKDGYRLVFTSGTGTQANEPGLLSRIINYLPEDPLRKKQLTLSEDLRRYDHMGRCVKKVKVDPSAQFEIFRIRLQTARPPSLIEKPAPPPSTGPLHFSLPLGNLEPKPTETVPKMNLSIPESNSELLTSASIGAESPQMSTITSSAMSSSAAALTSTTPLVPQDGVPLPNAVDGTPPDKLLDLFLQRLRGVAIVREGSTQSTSVQPITTERTSTTEQVRLSSPVELDAESADDSAKALESFLQHLRGRPVEKQFMKNTSTPRDSMTNSSVEPPISNPIEGSGDWTVSTATTSRIPLLEELRPEQEWKAQEEAPSVDQSPHPDFVRSAEKLNQTPSTSVSPPRVYSSHKLDEGDSVEKDGMEKLPSYVYRSNEDSIPNHNVFHSTKVEEEISTITTEESIPTTTELNAETTTFRFPEEEATAVDSTTVATTIPESTTGQETSTTNQQGETSTFWVPYVEQVLPNDQNVAGYSGDDSRFVLETSDVEPPFFLFEEIVSDVYNKTALQGQSIQSS